jgi:oligoendopeptidase F
MTTTTPIHWDLSDLHTTTSIEETAPLMQAIEEKVGEFCKTTKGKLQGFNAKQINGALKTYEAIRSDLIQIGQFAHLNYAVDMQNEAVLTFVSKLDDFSSDVSNQLLFFFLEIGSSPEDVIHAWCEDDLNAPYRYSLKQAFLKNKYRLTEKEEQLINIKDLTGIDALRKLYVEHTSRYTFTMDIDGEPTTMNGTQCRALRYHQNPQVRREAMALFFNQYKADAHVMVHLFNTVIKDVRTEAKKRGYETPISSMNIVNDLPNALVDMLHDVTTESNTLVARYYRAKQRLMGLDRMTLADIYAPMADTAAAIEWADAKSMVLDSFQAFDDDFYAYAKDMFDTNRLDVFPSNVKRGGAFCSSSRPDIRPYVMLNYLGKQRDVATLAHELGHAIHAYFSSEQPLMNYHAILPVCETASVFCEMLVVDALKKTTQTPHDKMVLLAATLEDMFATSHRQNMFSRFEKRLHDAISKQRVSGEDICTMYADELRLMFGDSVEIPDEYHWEWASIPHMLDVPFYVYSYNFGNLLVLGLYQLYLSEGAAFIPKLKRILKSGSSIGPVELLAREGIDITSKDFWQNSIAFMESILHEFEALAEQILV